ncbi:unnamed protein product, partial [Ectocarpus sp. 8 AP-2014]
VSGRCQVGPETITSGACVRWPVTRAGSSHTRSGSRTKAEICSRQRRGCSVPDNVAQFSGPIFPFLSDAPITLTSPAGACVEPTQFLGTCCLLPLHPYSSQAVFKCDHLLAHPSTPPTHPHLCILVT